ncbi:MAG: 50S ribosomal protein L18e [Candidatus Micrarchaeota archaeon]
MKRGTEIFSLKGLIINLEKAGRKNKAPIWKKAAFMLKKPSRQRVEINLNAISRIASDGDVLLVPGKVLGIGEITKKVKICAYRYSKSALTKMSKAGAQAVAIDSLIQTNPKGSKVRIII